MRRAVMTFRCGSSMNDVRGKTGVMRTVIPGCSSKGQVSGSQDFCPRYPEKVRKE